MTKQTDTQRTRKRILTAIVIVLILVLVIFIQIYGEQFIAMIKGLQTSWGEYWGAPQWEPTEVWN